MATERIRYVDTGSAGGDGTTSALEGANAAYASLSAMVTGEAGNLVTADVWLHVYCAAAGGTADTTACTINGFTTDATRYILIEGASGHRASTSWSTSKYRLSLANSVALTVSDLHVRLDGLQIETTAVSADGHHAVSCTIIDGLRVSKCHIRNTDSQNTYYAGALRLSASSATTAPVAWNTIFITLCERAAVSAAAVYSGYNITFTAYNCIFRAAREGIYLPPGGTLTLKNCYSYSENANSYSNVDTMVTCASDDATGSVDLQSKAYDTNMFTAVTDGAEDLSLAGAGSALYRTGTDTSGDAAPMNFTTDIDGDSYYDTGGLRSIGVDELVAATNMVMNII